MLVLTRKPNDSITIGPDIEVTVLAVSGNKVRIGVTAPRQVPVWRAELRERTSSEDPPAPALRAAA